MELMDIEDCLKSMTILVDTREQPSERAKMRYETFSFPYQRQKLDFGDYSAKFWLSNEWEMLPVAIERKMNLDELSTCFTRGRDRFKREFERAKSSEATVYLLVEEASWENVLNGRYKSRFSPKAYTASLIAWMARYDIKPIFCKPETTGRLISEILYRELKERLENGFYG